MRPRAVVGDVVGDIVGDIGDVPMTDPAAQAGGPQAMSDRVLLVEDNPVNQRVAIAMLEHLGFCTDVVDNGVEAVIAATMVPYRAILMDCQIPVLNGYDVTTEIRSQWGASRLSPIIAVTSSTSAPDRMRCRTAGMDGFLAKPLSLESLADGMARWAPEASRPAVSESAVDPDPAFPDDAPVGTDGPTPSLDAKVVARLRRLGDAAGEDLLGQLAAIFLPDADARIAAMRDALLQEDGSALIHSAHALCGASANLGAAALSRLCAHLATDGAVVDTEGAEELLLAVEAELERVRSSLVTPTLTLVPPERSRGVPCSSPPSPPPPLPGSAGSAAPRARP